MEVAWNWMTVAGTAMLAMLAGPWRLRFLPPVLLCWAAPSLVHIELQIGCLWLAALLFVLALVEAAGRRPQAGGVIPFSAKIVRIAHLSDLHYPSRSEDAATAVRDALAQLRPDFLVITGDLQNHPLIGAREPRSWIEQTARECGLAGPDGALLRERVIVIAGNHDVFLFGLTGVNAIGDALFRWQHGIRRDPVAYI